MPGWSKQMQGARVGKREGGGETGERTWMDGKVLGVNVRAGHIKASPKIKALIAQSSFISASWLLKKAIAF